MVGQGSKIITGLKVDQGNVNDPSITFLGGGSNTGIFLQGTNSITFVTGGQVALTISPPTANGGGGVVITQCGNLNVQGQLKYSYSGANAQPGYVLTSVDNSGNAIWAASSGGGNATPGNLTMLTLGNGSVSTPALQFLGTSSGLSSENSNLHLVASGTDIVDISPSSIYLNKVPILPNEIIASNAAAQSAYNFGRYTFTNAFDDSFVLATAASVPYISFDLYKKGTGNLWIQPSGGDTIESGSSNIALPIGYNFARLTNDGVSDWMLV